MKNIIVVVTLIAGVSAQASLFNFFDFTKFGEAALVIADGINENLEKVRLVQHEKLNIQEQWDITCETTQALNKSVEALNLLLGKYKVNQQVCLPISAILNLQADIIKNCQNYYSKPVPDNAEHLINKFTATLIQSKMLLNKCYPILKNIKLPGIGF
ncbi:MAG: hypothetical protein WA160_13445 [Pseudobdellovibrio sp.]